ncbi:MAG: biopolymer transporter ExbD [Candidatus Omnitrophica bacterium]|nr:biopolymer transporter ExbD [Candidatus Omnitrophota bacterium]
MKLPSSPVHAPARIQIVPLIDVIFFLLATFIMVSLSMVKNQGIPVQLPKAATGQSESRTATATITVTDAGRVYLNRELMEMDKVGPRLKALKRQEAGLKVLINADDVAYFGDVVKALDHVRRAGIDKIAIQTTGAQHASAQSSG